MKIKNLPDDTPVYGILCKYGKIQSVELHIQNIGEIPNPHRSVKLLVEYEKNLFYEGIIISSIISSYEFFELDVLNPESYSGEKL